jgi:hypothetical protein
VGEVVYETQTSPSTKFAGPPKSAADEAGVVSKGYARTFARKTFGPTASPYLSPYVHKRGVLDANFL